MFILSIDVGWKHLACCILHFYNDTWHIKDWKLYNIMESEDIESTIETNIEITNDTIDPTIENKKKGKQK